MTMYLSQKSKENVFSVSVVSFSVIHKSFVSEKEESSLSSNLVKSCLFLRNTIYEIFKPSYMVKILVKTEKPKNKGC